jgi:hypothetical protein
MKRVLCGLLAAALLLPALALSEKLTLSFIGDCSIGEAAQYSGYDSSYTNLIDRKGYGWPFSLVKDYLTADDLTFANLEVVFTNLTRHADKDYPLVAPPAYAQVLTLSGIDAVNTANNHAFDFLGDGYSDTLKTLDGIGMRHFGSLSIGTGEARDMLYVQEIKGIKVGAVGFSYPSDSDIDRMCRRVETLREQGCSLVIASLHWGRETHKTPQSVQVKYAKKLIDAGADVVWGHHPHVLQPVQFYKGKPVFYSTGNFTFGTMSKVDPDTGIFQLEYTLGDNGAVTLAAFTVIPCRTQGAGDFRAYELTDPAERAGMLKKLIYDKEINGMENLPASFALSGRMERLAPVTEK